MLVIDDASTDRTASLAAAGGAHVLSVRNRHIAATRNTGARAATGEYLFFIDADTWVNAPLLHAAVRALQQGAVGGGSRFRFDRPLPWYGKIAERIVPPLYSPGRGWPAEAFCFVPGPPLRPLAVLTRGATHRKKSG